MNVYAPRQWLPHEKPMLAGSPSTPDHPAHRRITYLIVGMILSITGGLGNALVTVNVNYLQGTLGASAVEVAWLPAAYMMTNVSINLLLVKAQLAVREAALENNGQDRLSAEASIRQAEAALSNAQAQMVKTRNDYKRISELVSSGAVSKSAYDSAKASDAQTAAQTLQTEAALEIAKQNLQSIIIKHASLEAEVENAKAALELARIDLDNTRIIAPGDGQLGQVSVRLGAYVTAGTQLTGLVPHHVWVIANMKETQMANIRIGQPAVFTVDALDHAEMHGHVERIAPASGSEFSVIPPDNATGNFVKISQRIPVRISVDPDQALSERLKPGMSVVVSIETKD